MGRLTEKEYWDSIYQTRQLEAEGSQVRYNLKVLAAQLVGERVFSSYANYLLWNVIYKKYMPKTKGLRVLEIGSAPGRHLVRLNQKFGFVPYGIEYSDVGVEVNRRIFSLNNIDPNNVIHADFFSDDFHKQYKGYFDVVLSKGFIEHFTNVEDVVEKHIDLLKPGGHLFASIPNATGFNYTLQCIFNRKVLAKHNTDIMKKGKLSKIFHDKGVTGLFCEYYGTFDFGVFVYKRKSVKFFCKILQIALNILLFVLLRDKGAESKWFSPHLIYVGVKTPAPLN